MTTDLCFSLVCTNPAHRYQIDGHGRINRRFADHRRVWREFRAAEIRGCMPVLYENPSDANGYRTGRWEKIAP